VNWNQFQHADDGGGDFPLFGGALRRDGTFFLKAILVMFSEKRAVVSLISSIPFLVTWRVAKSRTASQKGSIEESYEGQLL
jgi:hypothetical protein